MFNFELYDLNGKMIFQKKDNTGKIDIYFDKEIAAGMYLFSLSNGEKQARGKFLKK